MEKGLLDYLNHLVNAVRVDGVMFGREVLPNGVEFIVARVDGVEVPLYEFFHNPRKAVATSEKPRKSMGGKKPYLMVMIEEVEKLKNLDAQVTDDIIGFMVRLARNIEWGTGHLIDKRTKKPLVYDDLLKLYKRGNKKLNKLLAQMYELGLLENKPEGYFVSRRLIRRGRDKEETS